MAPSLKTYDVAIVGAGPTGLTLANLLGQAGLLVLLVERNASTVQAPRAVSIDDESLRTLQAAGLADEIIADVALDYGLQYLTPTGACFAQVEPKARDFGYPRRNAFTQPLLEATLRRGLDRFPNVETLFSHTCGEVVEDADGVTLEITPLDGTPFQARAAYVVGSDGGRSALRKVVGATLQGATYAQRWLIVDLGSTQERLRLTRVLCDPARPAICLPGPNGIRRYEFMLQDGEREEDVTQETFVRQLLAAQGPDQEAPIVRAQVYTFHARVADIWNTKRLYLAGDAAHLTPPFAGQGMNSGIRDAHNLAWKLIAVVKGELGAGLLTTYAAERAPHARALIDFAMNIGRVMMPTSRLQAFVVQGLFQLSKLIPPVHDYFAQYKYKPKPFYHVGFLASDDNLKLAGRMLPQPFVEDRARHVARLDTYLGHGFALVAVGLNAQKHLQQAANLDVGLTLIPRLAICPHRFNIDPQDVSGITSLRDVDDTLAKIGIGQDVLLLVRPDRYVALAQRITASADIPQFAAQARALVAATHTP